MACKCGSSPGSRWIQGVSAEQPLYEAAHRVLEARLCAIPYWLPLAAAKSNEGPEFVHQLRVSTRRAVEAVKVFSDLIQNDVSDQLQADLREIRLAADEARDLDVLYEQFSSWADELTDSVVTQIAKDLRRRRREAQLPIVAIHQKLASDRFAQEINELLKNVGSRRSQKARQPFGKQSPRYLKPALKKFFRASECDLTDDDTFHKLRIRGKKLRYTMEILAAAFPAGFQDRLYPQLVTLQDAMGRVNDHATARSLFASWVTDCEDAEKRAFFEGMMVSEAKAHQNTRNSFLAEWSPKAMRRLREQFAKYTELKE